MNIKQIAFKEADLVIALFNDYRVFYKQKPDMALAEKFIKDRLKSNESVIFVALQEDTPVGFTQLYPKYSSARAEKNWVLNDLYVAENSENRG